MVTEELKESEENLEQEKAEMPPPSEPSAEMVEQDRFYLDSLGKLTASVLFSVFLCVGLIIIFIALSVIRSPNPVYFAASDAEQLIHDQPLNQPNVPINVLFNWIAEGMMTIHTFNFVNYETVLERGREYFTKDGFESFFSALQEQKIIERVLEKKLVLRGVPNAAPQITKEGTLANFYLWKIKIPMLFRYRNVDTDTTDDAEITLLIVRVPTTEAPLGIRILKYDLQIKNVESSNRL